MTKRKMKELDDGTLVDVGWTDMDNQSYAYSQAGNYYGSPAVCKVHGKAYFSAEDSGQGTRWWPCSQEFYDAFIKEFQLKGISDD